MRCTHHRGVMVLTRLCSVLLFSLIPVHSVISTVDSTVVIRVDSTGFLLRLETFLMSMGGILRPCLSFFSSYTLPPYGWLFLLISQGVPTCHTPSMVTLGSRTISRTRWFLCDKLIRFTGSRCAAIAMCLFLPRFTDVGDSRTGVW